MEHSLSDVAKMFGIPITTLHYYDKQGLLPFLKKGANNYRYVDTADLPVFSFISYAKQAGFAVNEIGELVSAVFGYKHVADRQEAVAEFKRLKKMIEKHVDELLLRQNEIIQQLQVAGLLRWYIDRFTESGCGAMFMSDKYYGHLPESFSDTLLDFVSEEEILDSYIKKYPDSPTSDAIRRFRAQQEK